jgi:hypothetical protein
LEELLRVVREEKIELSGGSASGLPGDFDFATFADGAEFQQLWESGNANLLMLAWHAQDRDGAYAWLLENHGAKSLAAITRLPEGDIAGNLKWMGGKFESLDPAQRREFLDEMQLGWTVFPADLATFTQGIGDLAVLDETRAAGVQGIFAGKTRDVMPLLEAIEDPARRVEILESAEPSAVFTGRPDLRSFGESDEALLRKKLAEWKAGKKQIERIISRFKP